ncbi:MAG: EpsD family peptidyl-prolyl cis-trans isomerase [Rugosibacter sp.]|nr:EpsD family peptidyl-prolyl cis-trans isomerase [Rugosibacter sp.]
MLAFPCRNNLILLLLVAALAGCGSDDEKKPATQVAAKVNKEEISVHQINNVLARTGNISPEQAKAASKQILEKLVDQELLVQQAMESKLDRDPKTMQAIEAARREILSRAYLDKVASSLVKPTPDEVRDFYTKHPELFSERRIYQFQQLAIQTTASDFLPRLQQQMSNVKSLAEVAAWLNTEKIPFAANSGTKAAEELPMELLPKFHQMKDGQIGVIPGRDGVMVVQLTASRSMSMDEKAATPFIEQFLNNQRRMEAAEKEMKQLREKAKIEYMGEFATAKADDEKIKAADPKPAPAVPAETKADTTHMGKGLSGLK